MSLAATLASRLALLVGGRVALLLLSLGTMAVLTRSLGPDGFGLYRSAVGYLGIVLVFTDLGLLSVFVREISRPDADQPRLIANALALRLALAVTVFILSAGLAFVLPFDSDVRIAILLGAGGFVAYSIHLLLFGLFQQKLRQQGAVVAELAGGLLLLGLVITLAELSAAPIWFVGALALSYLVTVVVTLTGARRLAPIGLRFEPSVWRQLIVSALPVAATASIGVIFFRADVVFLTFLQPPSEVGLYGVALKVLDALTGFTLLLVGLFAPLFGRTASHAPAQFAAHLENALMTLTIGTAGVAVVLLALAEEIVVVLGGEAFRAAGPALMLLGAVFVLNSVLVLVREAATALGVQSQLIPGYLTGLAIAIAAYLTLIPPLGGSGAALALIITEVVILIAAFRVVIRATDHPISTDGSLRALASGVAAAVVVLVLQHAAFGWPWQVAAGLVSYGLLLLLTGAVSLPAAIAIGRDMMAKKRAH